MKSVNPDPSVISYFKDFLKLFVPDICVLCNSSLNSDNKSFELGTLTIN